MTFYAKFCLYSICYPLLQFPFTWDVSNAFVGLNFVAMGYPNPVLQAGKGTAVYHFDCVPCEICVDSSSFY